MTPSALLLIATMALVTLYVIGVGGTTATAIRIREAWRHRKLDDGALLPRGSGEFVLSAPRLTGGLKRLRFTGWAAFGPALVLAIFADRAYPWVSPVVVLLMVAINAFYFTAMQNMGEELTLTPDGFRVGSGRGVHDVRWVHVTEFTGARIGPFSGMKMAEDDEWQDPKVRPNVIFYRLNRALTTTRKSLYQRLIGFSYYDGLIRNAFGLPTQQLLRAMRDWQRRALELEDVPLGPNKKG
jgi:hypothetical protein